MTQRSYLVETSLADRYLFESEEPLEGGQRVISTFLGKSKSVSEKREDEMLKSSKIVEDREIIELPACRY